MFKKIRLFFEKEMWQTPYASLKGVKGFFSKAVRISYLTVRSFTQDQCMMRAASLTYYSVMALVPALALAFSIAQGLKIKQYLEAQLYQRFSEQKEVLNVLFTFANNLLNFLNATDPGNLLVSNFIVSLAQKGKLTTFFPEDSKEQEQILDLVAQSAFKDENTIILFSATFMHLLEVLEPSARSFLVNRMSQLADDGTASFSRLASTSSCCAINSGRGFGVNCCAGRLTGSRESSLPVDVHAVRPPSRIAALSKPTQRSIHPTRAAQPV